MESTHFFCVSAFLRFCVSFVLIISTVPTFANDFITAAMRRESAFSQFEIRIDTEEEHRPGSTDTFVRPDTAPAKAGTQPSKTVRFATQTDVLIAGHKIRLSEAGRIWNASARDFVPHQYRITNDGNSLRSLSLNDPQDTKKGYGIIEYPNQAPYRRQSLQPILFSFRGGESRLSGVRAVQFKPTGRQVSYNGRSLPEWERREGSNSLSVLVDPQQDWAACKLIQGRGAKIDMTIDIENVKDEPSGMWYPKRWVIQNYRHSDGQLLSILKSELMSMNLTIKSRDSDFELNFPEGLYVSNNITRTQYRAERNGGLTPITTDGEELPVSHNGKVILIIVLGILVFFALVIGYLRYSIRNHQLKESVS